MNTRNMYSLLVMVCCISFILLANTIMAQDNTKADASLKGAGDEDLGMVQFNQGPNGVLLSAHLQNLPPGIHAFHIHGIGACTPDFKAAGGHLNPSGKKHGFMNPGGPHAGDLPNIHVSDSGELEFELFLPGISLNGGDFTLLDGDGSAIVIHEGVDDYQSDPAGAAGNRIACGVIEAR